MKTLKQAAEEHLEKVTDGYEYPEFDGIDITDAFIAGAEYANRWIPVEENLPKETEEVLYKVLDDEGEEKIIFGTLKKWDFELWEDKGGFKITHWRPIELK